MQYWNTLQSQVKSISSAPAWDLSDLYNGLEDPAIQTDLQSLSQFASQFRETYRSHVNRLSPIQIADCLHQLEAMYERSGYLYAFPALIFNANTQDKIAKQAMDRAMEAYTQLQNQLLFCDLELKQLTPEQFQKLTGAPELQTYQHYFAQIAKFRPYLLPEAVEQTRNQSSLTGREAFIQLRSVHLGEQTYPPVTPPDGQTASTEAELGALSFHPDRDTRTAAYQSIRSVMKTHNSLYAYILNAIAQDHRLENEMRGHGSTLEKQLLGDQVSESVFNAIMEGMNDRSDLFQRYYRLKGKALGQTIRSADLYAPWSLEAVPAIPYEEGVKTLMAAIEQFDVNYARRAEEFFVNNWVDATVRPGKQGGAFCWYIHGKHSYLLQSYTEDHSSLFTLAHEMGHGLHFAWIGDRQSYFNSMPPMVSAEIASTFNELLLLDYLLKQAEGDKELTKTLITRQLEDQLSLLFRQSTISRLERRIHDRATEGTFDATFVNQAWMELYKNLCGDAVELLPEHQYDWARIGHIFFKPFYCYQYTASTIVSLACYQKYLEVGKAFIPGYLELLSVGDSMDQVEALKKYVGVDLEDTATIREALQYVERLIDRLEESID
ncbi:MAG: M3 family metallopeptidase [Cyanobacteria bacterium]|nr:M3 family metallopeptidase [Cyanobacteriota bacterium]